jgi:GNAT superfamily N-acetyltransferase
LDTTEFHGYRVHWVHGQSSPQLRSQIVAFWREQNALSDAHEAWRRTFEVACIAVDQAGRIAGVSSVYSAQHQALGAPYWFYRNFIDPEHRVNGLAQRMVRHTVERLAGAFAGEAGAPLGVIIVSENAKLDAPAGQRQLNRLGFVRLGADQAGRSVWQRRFAVPADGEAQA